MIKSLKSTWRVECYNNKKNHNKVNMSCKGYKGDCHNCGIKSHKKAQCTK